MALAHTTSVQWIGITCLAAMLTGCVSSTQNLAGSPLGLTGNYTLGSTSNDKKPNSRLHLAYARLKESEGDSKGARDSYEQVLAETPRSTDAILGIARLDQLAGRNEAAEKGLERALKLEPKSPVVLDAAGQFYAGLGRWDEATRSLTEATRYAPTEKAYQHHLAIALAKSGRIDQSLPHFVQAVGPAKAHYNIGYILHEKGDIKGSEQQFTLALMKDPNLEEAQYWVDEVRREQGLQVVSASSVASPAAASSSPHFGANGANRVPQRQPAERPAGNAIADFPRTAQFSNGGHRSPGNAPATVATAGQYPTLPRITSGQTHQEPQAWPGAAASAPVAASRPAAQHASAPAAPVHHPAPYDQIASRNRIGTSLLPSPDGTPSGVTLQQWEQWNNQRANAAGGSSNTAISSKAGVSNTLPR